MNTKFNSIDEMKNIRIFYSKLSRAKYISHLDITRCMQRALKRAEIPAWYTEGFNPHIYITFALPLSLGYESDFETMDLRLSADMPYSEVMDRLNKALPPDIHVNAVKDQVNKPDKITTALYEIIVSDEEKTGEQLLLMFNEFMKSDKIEVEKRSKKGIKTIDIKPDCDIISINPNGNAIQIEMKASTGLTRNINPSLLTDEFIKKYITTATAAILRKMVYMEDGKEFE